MKGAYILLLRIKRNCTLSVGSLGRSYFAEGNYAYVGSALTSLTPRMDRHFAKKKKTYWHIDYLTTSRIVKVECAVYAVTGSRNLECALSFELSMLPSSAPIRSFGSSDCRHGCDSHLYLLETPLKESLDTIISIFDHAGLPCFIYRADKP